MARTQTDRAVIDLVINGQSAKTSLKEVSLEVQKARSALIKMHEADDPKLYKERQAEMHKLINAQRSMKASIDDTATAWSRFKKEAGTQFVGVFGGNIATAALTALAGAIPAAIDHTMKLKDAFANMEKATGMSTEQVQKFNKELKAIDTRTTSAELREIAIAGGQLGVANDQLLEFVKNSDMAVVALGDEFLGGVEEVAKSLGGIGKLFAETRDQDIGKNINSIGSALNDLGAAGSATSPVVAEFTTRIGQLGGLAPTISQTLGLGAAMQELGLTSEIASSGLSGLLLTAASKSALFAQQLKMTKTEMEALMNKSPNEFLMALAKSFAGLSATQVAQRLKELKVESQESIKVMSLLANQTDFVRTKQDMAAKSMREGTSLTDEFAKKNHQLARDLKDLSEWFNSLLTSPSLQTFLVEASHNAVEFIKAMPAIKAWVTDHSKTFLVLAGATLMYNQAIIAATISAVANTTAEVYRRIAYEVGFKWMVLTSGSTRVLNVLTAALTGQITLQTAAITLSRMAMTAFNAVMLASPVGIIIGLMTGLAYAVKLYSDNTEHALKFEREKLRLSRDLQLQTEVQTKKLADLNGQMGDYNQMSQKERAEYVKNVAVGKLELETRLIRMKARQKEMEMLALEPSLWDKLWAAIKSGGNASSFAANLTLQGAEAMKAVRTQFATGISALGADVKSYDTILKQVNSAEKVKDNFTGGTMVAIKSTEKKASSKKSEAQKDAEELEKMLADSRQRIMVGEETDYHKEVADFSEKYTKMYELAKTNQAKIDEIRRLSLLEFDEIDKRRLLKEAEAAKKTKKEDDKKGYDTALNGLDADHEKQIKGLELDQANSPKIIGDTELNMSKLEADQAYFTQKLILEKTFAQESAETQRNLTENWHQQQILKAQYDHAYAEKAKETEWALHDAKRDAMAAGVSIAKGFLKEHTIAYKVAIAAQKAFAIAQIIIDNQREVAQIAANPTWSLMPDGGLGLKTAAITVSKIRMIGGIAQVLAAGVGEMIAAKAEGGYTGINELYPGSRGASGFVNVPTVFNMGRRSFMAGEAGREFVINNQALQQPVVADFVKMMDVAQKTGNYGILSGAAAGGSQAQTYTGDRSQSAALGQPGLDLTPLLMELQAVRSELKATGSKPVDFNYRAFEQYKERVEEIRTVTSL